MSYFIAVVFILLLLIFWVLNFFSLPGNWINILLLGIWKLLYTAMPAGWWFFVGLVLLAILGEIIEFFSQYWGAKRYGATGKGGWGAFLGALLGAIFGAPFLLGVGALIGAVAGSFLGSLIVEVSSGRNWPEAWRASKGAMWGRVFGFVAKAGLGMVMISWSVPKIWPG